VATFDEFSAEYCSLFSDCCAQVQLPTDGKTCRAFQTLLMNSRTYDPVWGQKCVAELREAQKAPDFCETHDAYRDSCKRAFATDAHGTRQPGESCEVDNDCAPAADGDVECVSNYDGASVTHTCSVLSKGRLGDQPCLGTQDPSGTWSPTTRPSSAGPLPARAYLCQSAQLQFCDGAAKACVERLQAGAGCSSDLECVPTAFCDFSGHKCIARSPPGATCRMSSSCDASSWCDLATKKCTARLTAGASCAEDQCQQGLDCTDGVCAKASGSGLEALCGWN
jgi:hypothetical protein